MINDVLGVSVSVRRFEKMKLPCWTGEALRELVTCTARHRSDVESIEIDTAWRHANSTRIRSTSWRHSPIL